MLNKLAFFCMYCRSFTAHLKEENYTINGEIRRSHLNRLLQPTFLQIIQKLKKEICPLEKYLNLVRKSRNYYNFSVLVRYKRQNKNLIKTGINHNKKKTITKQNF